MARRDIGWGYTWDTEEFIDKAVDNVGLVLMVAGVPALVRGGASLAARYGGSIIRGGGKLLTGAGKQIMSKGRYAAEIIGGGAQLISSVANAVPKIRDEVTVTVRGQPGASKKQLYFLAMAAASGTVKRWAGLANPLFTPIGQIMIEYDAAENWVICSMMYEFNTAFASSIDTAARNDFFTTTVVFNGPPCNVVGKPLSFTDASFLPGIPSNSDFINLPFKDKVILTDCPTVNENDVDPSKPVATVITPPIATPNALPSGDHRSRGSVKLPGGSAGDCCTVQDGLVSLVYASLSVPGSYQQGVFTAPTTGTLGK